MSLILATNIFLCLHKGLFTFIVLLTPFFIPMRQITKRLKNGCRKCFNQLLGVRSTQKLVEIHNTSTYHCTSKLALYYIAQMVCLPTPFYLSPYLCPKCVYMCVCGGVSLFLSLSLCLILSVCLSLLS